MVNLFLEPWTWHVRFLERALHSEKEMELLKSSLDLLEGIVLKRRPKHVNCSCFQHRENADDFPGEMREMII